MTFAEFLEDIGLTREQYLATLNETRAAEGRPLLTDADLDAPPAESFSP